MKQVIALIFSSIFFIGCGGKSKSHFLGASSEELIQQGRILVDQSDCNTCHHRVNKIVGPSHTDVAKKYEFTEANVDLLANRIIKGGSGVWGEIPMTPHTDLSKENASKMAYYVLSLDGEKIK